MNETLRQVLAVVLTFILTRTGYALLEFNPMKYFSGILGYAIDIFIWLVIYFAISWILKKLLKTEFAKN